MAEQGAAISTACAAPAPARLAPALMPRVTAIWEHPRFQGQLAGIEAAEATRPFCRHGLAHLLDVARIAWIFTLERELGWPRDLVYAAALLHDIGRGVQYACGCAHDEAGARLAAEILGTVEPEWQFPAREQELIVAAVRGHRQGHRANAEPGAEVPGASRRAEAPAGSACASAGAAATGADAFAALIAEADACSRPCYACAAAGDCYWTAERRNRPIGV